MQTMHVSKCILTVLEPVWKQEEQIGAIGIIQKQRMVTYAKKVAMNTVRSDWSLDVF